MSEQPKKSRVVERCCAIGFGLSAVLSIALFVFCRISSFSTGQSLLLFGEGGLHEILLRVLRWLVLPPLFCLGICTALCQLRRNYWLTLLYLVVTLAVSATYTWSGGDLYLMGIRKRLMPADEAAYIRFAQKIRTQAKTDKCDFISFDPNCFPERSPDLKPYLDILDSSVVASWPRRFLIVQIEDDTVKLSRGTGMLGTIGVKIFDLYPELTMSLPEKIHDNPGIYEEVQLSPRVLFFTRD